VSDNLTPTAQAILDALREHPATATDLREATGRSRSTIDKALADLAKTGLVTKTTPDDSDTEGPTQWALTDPNHDSMDHEPTNDDTEPNEPASGPDHPQDDDPHSRHGTADPGPSTNNPSSDADDPDPAGPPPAEQEDDTSAETPTDGDGPPPEDEVKVCRGCGEQMPRICPTCGMKTTTYCGTCRKTHPTRRRLPGQPEILANGLPKLTRGELERLVLDVIRTQPLPNHLGITGWTSGRVAIFLPGRSTGAIGNALDKLAATGRTELIGDNPKRYQPTPDPQPPADIDQQDDGHDAQHPGSDERGDPS
jgi:hypothetical protein